MREQLRVLKGTDHGGDGEAEAGRQVELESEGRQIDLRTGFAGVDGDVRQQIAESAQALGSRGAGGVVGGKHSEIRGQAEFHGVGERERDGSGGDLVAWHAALEIAADLDGAVDYIGAGLGAACCWVVTEPGAWRPDSGNCVAGVDRWAPPPPNWASQDARETARQPRKMARDGAEHIFQFIIYIPACI